MSKWWLAVPALGLALAAQAKGWEVRPEGLGPYRVGARYDNLGKTFGGLGPARTGSDKACLAARSLRYPQVTLVFVRKVLVRVDVAGGFGTERGVRIGDTAARLRRVYGDAVRAHPSHPDWLMVQTGGGALGLRYVMRAGRVAAIHAGQHAQLQNAATCP